MQEIVCDFSDALQRTCNGEGLVTAKLWRWYRPSPLAAAAAAACSPQRPRPRLRRRDIVEGAPEPGESPAPVVFQRGEFLFNRRFFDTKLPGFFRGWC